MGPDIVKVAKWLAKHQGGGPVERSVTEIAVLLDHGLRGQDPSEAISIGLITRALLNARVEYLIESWPDSEMFAAKIMGSRRRVGHNTLLGVLVVLVEWCLVPAEPEPAVVGTVWTPLGTRPVTA